MVTIALAGPRSGMAGRCRTPNRACFYVPGMFYFPSNERRLPTYALTHTHTHAVADHVVDQLKERGDPWRLNEDQPTAKAPST